MQHDSGFHYSYVRVLTRIVGGTCWLCIYSNVLLSEQNVDFLSENLVKWIWSNKALTFLDTQGFTGEQTELRIECVANITVIFLFPDSFFVLLQYPELKHKFEIYRAAQHQVHMRKFFLYFIDSWLRKGVEWPTPSGWIKTYLSSSCSISQYS